MNRRLLVLMFAASGLVAYGAWAGQSGAPILLAQQSVQSGGHTTDMPTREGHTKEHEKASSGGQAGAVTEGGHTTDMPAREPHSKSHNKKKKSASKKDSSASAGAPVTSGQHTTDMPNREGHKPEHENK